MEEKSGNRPHACFLQNRAAANLTGVREVVSFDENQVIMDTDLGLLTLKGKELHVSRLSVEKGEFVSVRFPLDDEYCADNLMGCCNVQ